jgi:hypothetical protein
MAVDGVCHVWCFRALGGGFTEMSQPGSEKIIDVF